MSDPNLAHRWAYTFLTQLRSLGVERVFVAPGSRSTVLALQAFNLFGKNLITHFDERGLGFLALGAAKASRKATCIITTSGTAVANLLPAVIEARYSHVPLIILSADRPPEMQDRGCNQTIDQKAIFGTHALAYHEIRPPEETVPLEDLQTWAISAWHDATRPRNEGAVQVNWMFREPFFASESADASVPLDTPAPLTITSTTPPASPDLETLAEILSTTTRGICVVGALESPEEAAAARSFVAKLGWVTFADSLSQLRQDNELNGLMSYGDMSLLASLPGDLQPDTILHIGGRLVSKRISTLLAPSAKAKVVSVSSSSDYFNPNDGIQRRIVAPLEGLTTIAVSAPQDSEFQASLSTRNSKVGSSMEKLFGELEGELSEPALLRALSLHTPNSHTLMLGNSMPIRDFEMFAVTRSGAPRTIANRGASGIDGIIATACGAALGGKTPVTLVVGDLSALHDLNSLALARSVKTPFPIIVINNDGGGIFSLLPVSKTEHFEPLFGTPHGLRFHEITRGFGIPYTNPSSMEEFMRAYQNATSHQGASVIEVTTNRHANAELHRAISKEIATSLSTLR
jgi:2-succinyl-5-enolpyruvyl-6-hydroxy-3-cyclohexene-1-carboxylate synthase